MTLILKHTIHNFNSIKCIKNTKNDGQKYSKSSVFPYNITIEIQVLSYL